MSRVMRRLLVTLCAGMFVSLALAACGGSSSTPPTTDATPADTPQQSTATAAATHAPAAATIAMGPFSFSGGPSVTIKAGQAVAFDDSNGGTHVLVTGSQGTFSAEAGAPTEFGASGLSFSPGDVKVVTFATAGTYHITCTIHPSMQATVTVTA